MKKLVIFSLVSLLLLPLLAVGCGGGGDKTIELASSDFAKQNNIVKNIELGKSDSLTVKLGANPTTGYSWEEADISNTAVIAQASRDYTAPEAGLVGAGGTEVWVFNSKNTGSATIKFSYGQPWENGEKDAFTLTINVTVK